jgi:hypothetical protein
MNGVLFIDGRTSNPINAKQTFIPYSKINRVSIEPERELKETNYPWYKILFLGYPTYENAPTGEWLIRICTFEDSYIYKFSTKEQAEKAFNDIKNNVENLIIS